MPAKTKPFVFLKILGEIFPEVSPEKLSNDALELSKHKNAEGYMALLENPKKQSIDEGTLENLKAIYEEGVKVSKVSSL